MDQWIGILGGIALIVGFIFLMRRPSDSAGLKEAELYKLCRGDRTMMERLISHEQERRKGCSREMAVKVAIDSIKRDNR